MRVRLRVWVWVWGGREVGAEGGGSRGKSGWGAPMPQGVLVGPGKPRGGIHGGGSAPAAAARAQVSAGPPLPHLDALLLVESPKDLRAGPSWMPREVLHAGARSWSAPRSCPQGHTCVMRMGPARAGPPGQLSQPMATPTLPVAATPPLQAPAAAPAAGPSILLPAVALQSVCMQCPPPRRATNRLARALSNLFPLRRPGAQKGQRESAGQAHHEVIPARQPPRPADPS